MREKELIIYKRIDNALTQFRINIEFCVTSDDGDYEIGIVILVQHMMKNSDSHISEDIMAIRDQWSKRFSRIYMEQALLTGGTE